MSGSVERKYRPFSFESENSSTSFTLEIAPDQKGAHVPTASKPDQTEHIFYVRLPNGMEHHLVVRRRPEGILEIAIGEGEAFRILRVPFAVLESEIDRKVDGEPERVAFSYEGQTYTFHLAQNASPTAYRSASRAGKRAGTREPASGLLTAPMAGVVSEVLVTEGQTVAAYQPLVVLEAMKVMTTLDAPFAGIVRHLHVHPRQQIVHGAPVVEVVKL